MQGHVLVRQIAQVLAILLFCRVVAKGCLLRIANASGAAGKSLCLPERDRHRSSMDRSAASSPVSGNPSTHRRPANVALKSPFGRTS